MPDLPARPPRGPVPGPLGALASRVYAYAMDRRNRRFDRGRGVVRFDRPVISVGNLSVGGTGKTPTVALLVRALRDAGHRPCIAMRGYGGKGPARPSDEADEYRRRFPDLPIVAQPNRTLGLIHLFGREFDAGGPHTDCILLDDGFQHRQIGRELDIVLVDASRGDPALDRVFPAGWLREPPASLARADAVVVTHAESAAPSTLAAIDRTVAAARGGRGGVDAVARHAWASLTVGDAPEPADWLRARRVLAVCALGNPGPFLAEARRAAREVVGELVLRDHDPYLPATLRRLTDLARAPGVDAILTTEKDWTKLAPHAARLPVPVARPSLELRFDRGGPELLELALATVRAGVPEDQASDPPPRDATPVAP